MSIIVRCDCGKRFKTPDQLLGKRVRCPGCKQPVVVRSEKEKQATSAENILEAEVVTDDPAPTSKVAAKSSRKLPTAPPGKRDSAMPSSGGEEEPLMLELTLDLPTDSPASAASSGSPASAAASEAPKKPVRVASKPPTDDGELDFGPEPPQRKPRVATAKSAAQDEMELLFDPIDEPSQKAPGSNVSRSRPRPRKNAEPAAELQLDFGEEELSPRRSATSYPARRQQSSAKSSAFEPSIPRCFLLAGESEGETIFVLFAANALYVDRKKDAAADAAAEAIDNGKNFRAFLSPQTKTVEYSHIQKVTANLRNTDITVFWKGEDDQENQELTLECAKPKSRDLVMDELERRLGPRWIRFVKEYTWWEATWQMALATLGLAFVATMILLAGMNQQAPDARDIKGFKEAVLVFLFRTVGPYPLAAIGYLLALACLVWIVHTIRHLPIEDTLARQ